MKLLTFIVAFLSCTLFASETKPVEASKDASPNYEQFFFQKLEKYTEKGEQTLDKAVDTLEKEVPLVVNEYLTWKFWESATNLIILGLSVIVYLGICFFLFKNKNFEFFGDDPLGFGGTMFLMICGALLLVVIPIVGIKNAKDCLQLSIAPKVYLIERASELIKK
jgi:hypothetical protein